MILHPSILALLASSALISLMVLYSTFFGIQILRRWDITSGSELQLTLERRTYLVSTIVGYFLAFQAISLFLFIYTADSICTLFVGAMCAVGTLTVNSLGYPVLIIKLITCMIAGLWLILNYADNMGYDYPLIKTKYRVLAIFAPLVLAETVLQAAYFMSLTPDIITSCCGSLFSTTRQNIAAEIAALPSLPMKTSFYACMLLTVITGLRFYLKGKWGYMFSAMSGISFIIAIISLISFISLYVYELPSHHCPFCLLQKEYGYIGYPLYGLLLTGVISGLGIGILMPFRTIPSLAEGLPPLQKTLAMFSVVSYIIFTAIASYHLIFSNLRLGGY
jgi:hypothetical protein